MPEPEAGVLARGGCWVPWGSMFPMFHEFSSQLPSPISMHGMRMREKATVKTMETFSLLLLDGGIFVDSSS